VASLAPSGGDAGRRTKSARCGGPRAVIDRKARRMRAERQTNRAGNRIEKGQGRQAGRPAGGVWAVGVCGEAGSVWCRGRSERFASG
jgi:hypothetical protein